MASSLVPVLLCVFAFCLAPTISAEDSSSKKYVLTLDHSNFSDTIAKHDFIVVEFYAPWCGHCKSLEPEYEKAASILSSHDPQIVLAKVDANEESNKDLAGQYEVKGFPTLKILRKGGKAIQDYKGPRKAEEIVEYLKKQSGPASVELKSTDDASTLIVDKNIVIVGVFPKLSGQEFENFIALAEKLRSEYEFGHTSDAKHLPRGESSVSGPLVRLFKPFDELFVDSKDFNVDALEKFVEESSTPTVTVYDNDCSNRPFVSKYFNSSDAKAMLFTNFSNEVTDSLKPKFHEVAEKYKGEGIVFLMGDVEATQRAFQYFGLREDQAPLIIIQTANGQKYLKPNVEADQVAPWLKDYKDGKVTPFRKSEPIPEVNDEPVKVVVADSLQQIVFNSGKNVLLEFYNPWCGNCPKFVPILDQVASSFQKEADVVIAKLDATKNDYPTDIFDVQGYPTLYFISSSGAVVQYDGGTKKHIVEFIENNRNKAPQAVEQEAEAEAEAAKDEM